MEVGASLKTLSGVKVVWRRQPERGTPPSGGLPHTRSHASFRVGGSVSGPRPLRPRLRARGFHHDDDLSTRAVTLTRQARARVVLMPGLRDAYAATARQVEDARLAGVGAEAVARRRVRLPAGRRPALARAARRRRRAHRASTAPPLAPAISEMARLGRQCGRRARRRDADRPTVGRRAHFVGGSRPPGRAKRGATHRAAATRGC